MMDYMTSMFLKELHGPFHLRLPALGIDEVWSRAPAGEIKQPPTSFSRMSQEFCLCLLHSQTLTPLSDTKGEQEK